MCRWFVYISAEEECLLEDVLITPHHGLAKMVNDHYLPGLVHADANHPKDKNAEKEAAARNIVLNIDGLGLAWYTNIQSDFNRDRPGLWPALYKSTSTPLNDFNFHSICANTSTRLLLAHIRASSGSAVTTVNCHPFIFGRQSFMHNGTITMFVDIRRQLCNLLDDDAFSNVHGSTDTEHLAALYMSILTKRRGKAAWDEDFSCGEMVTALSSAVGTVIRLQQEALGENARPNSLNLAVADGSKMVCFRFRNHKSQEPPSLYWSIVAGQTLNRKYPGRHDGTENPSAYKEASEHGRHLIVASEPTTYKAEDWHLMGRNTYLAMDGKKVTIDDIPYEDSWNVDDDPSS